MFDIDNFRKAAKEFRKHRSEILKVYFLNSGKYVVGDPFEILPEESLELLKDIDLDESNIGMLRTGEGDEDEVLIFRSTVGAGLFKCKSIENVSVNNTVHQYDYATNLKVRTDSGYFVVVPVDKIKEGLENKDYRFFVINHDEVINCDEIKGVLKIGYVGIDTNNSLV